MTGIGRAPNDAVHDCGDRYDGYNEQRAAQSNDAAFTASGDLDGKMDSF
jgi:hypothetical protein